MKPGGGRAKGSSFERTIAAQICITFGFDKEHCYRTPGSGGHRQACKTDPGDLVISRLLAKVFPYSVECKCYANINLPILLTTKKIKGIFSMWWFQCTRDAMRQKGRHPILIFKQNRGQVFCMVQRSLFNIKGYNLGYNRIETRLNGEWVVVMLFSRFLKLVKEGLI